MSGRATHTLRFRLVAAFSTVVAAFGAAVAFVFLSIARIHEATHDLAMREEAVRYGLTLASCGRDQYIHTAHLIITHDEHHVNEVREVVKRMRNCQEHVRMAVSDDKERATLDDLDAAAEEFRRVFFEGIVPAVREHRAQDALDLHAKSEELLARIISDNDRLSSSFRARIDEANRRVNDLGAWAVSVSAAALFLGVGTAIVVGLRLGRSILDPVRDLVAGTEAVARGERLPSLPPAPIAELDRLRQSFEKMAHDLAARERALVEAEKRASMGLLAAGIAHQINNPIGVILGYARLLEEGRVSDPKSALRILHDEAGEAKRIVETLLSLTRPGSVTPEEVRVAELIAGTIEHVRRYRRDARAQVRVECDPDLVARTDARKLQQVLTNLVVNGLEAMPRGGTVVVSAERRDGDVVLEVSDEGPGLSKEEMERLFDPYFTTKKTGTGLGLAITQEIVQALGGRVEVRPRAPRGCVFSVRLPEEGRS